MTTREEESRAKSRLRRARSSRSSAEADKDTQRIVPRGPAGESGRLKKIDDLDLRDAPPAEELEAPQTGA